MKDEKHVIDAMFDEFEDDYEPSANNMSPSDISLASAVAMRIYHYKDLLPNPKQSQIFDIKDVESKAESIEQVGLLQAPLVQPIAGSNQAVIIAGHKRVKAIAYLVEENGRKDLEYIRCQEFKNKDDAASEIALIDTNLEASELSNYEKMMAIGRKEELLKASGSKGTLRSVIAEKSHLNETQIGYYLRCYKSLIPEGKELLRSNKLTLKQAIDLASEYSNNQKLIVETMKNKDLPYDAAKKQMYDDYLNVFTEEQKAIIIGVITDRLSSREDKANIKENLTIQSLKKLMETERYSGYSSLDPNLQFINICPDYLQIKGLGEKNKITWTNVLKILKDFQKEAYGKEIKNMKTLNEIEKSLINLSDEELENLKMVLNKEITKRKKVTVNVCYEHDCKDSSKYHLKKYKHWSKLIEEVDLSKRNGYAFIGRFLTVDKQNIVPSGALVVERCDDRLRCYRITSERKELACEGQANSMVTFISAVNEALLEGGK